MEKGGVQEVVRRKERRNILLSLRSMYDARKGSTGDKGEGKKLWCWEKRKKRCLKRQTGQGTRARINTAKRQKKGGGGAKKIILEIQGRKKNLEEAVGKKLETMAGGRERHDSAGGPRKVRGERD